MKINSIKKGKSFEREVAHKLTELTNCKWQRVPCSGGFATSHNTTDSRFDGDVFCEDEKYKNLVIECKATSKKILITDIFNHKSLLYSFIEQARQEAKGKDWLLIVKMNNITPFYVCERERFIPNKKYECIIDSYYVIDKYDDIFKNLNRERLSSNFMFGLFK